MNFIFDSITNVLRNFIPIYNKKLETNFETFTHVEINISGKRMYIIWDFGNLWRLLYQ